MRHTTNTLSEPKLFSADSEQLVGRRRVDEMPMEVNAPPTGRRKLVFGIVALGLLLAAGGGYQWYSAGGGKPTFRSQQVMRGDLFIGVTATGTVEPVEIIDVGAQIVGSIKSFGPDLERPGKTVDYRSRVKKGAVLAHLDDQPHVAKLENEQTALKLAEAELNRSRTKLKQAKRDFARAEELKDIDSVAEYENAMSTLEMAKADLAMSEAKVEQAKIALKQAEINLGYTIIRSPVDGVVIDRRVNVGQTVVAGLNAPSLFLMAKDLSHMMVWAAVNEADIGDVHVGQKVTFKVDAYNDRTFTGKVSQIRLNAGLQQNVVTYGVVVDVDNRDNALLPYMTAKLQFEVARRSNALLVPNQVLRWKPTWAQISPDAREGLTEPNAAQASADATKSEGQEEGKEPTVSTATPTVWVVADDGLVRPVPIKVGLSDGTVTEIVHGDLDAGTEVVGGVVREAQADFVSSFISKVTKK